MPEYEPVIGLEVHAQLLTKSKMFCSCSAQYGGEPNTQVCPVCLGLPGALPVANEAAVQAAVKMGLATNSKVAARSVFARKNYFYPDCPKNYQISQFELPLCQHGVVVLENERRIGITRIHLEEDAGKLLHDEGDGFSYVDMNRVGVPLIEIVSEPDIRTPKEASEYLQKLRSILQYLDICDGNMEEGSLRADVNISLREKGTEPFGTKTEVKNLNSFRAAEQALEFEIGRQEKVLRDGGTVKHETLLWDSVRNEARLMRSKEGAHDYRYFPEPDLIVLDIEDDLIEEVRRSLPELPGRREARFVEEMNLPAYDARVLTASKDVADYFETTADELKDAKTASNWVMGEVLRELKERKVEIKDFRVTPTRLCALIKELKGGRINTPTAKEVFKEMAESGADATKIIASKGLEQISDSGVLDSAIAKILGGHPEEVERYLEGEQKLLKFLVGQVMKETRGKAPPQKVSEMLVSEVEKRQK